MCPQAMACNESCSCSISENREEAWFISENREEACYISENREEAWSISENRWLLVTHDLPAKKLPRKEKQSSADITMVADER